VSFRQPNPGPLFHLPWQFYAALSALMKIPALFMTVSGFIVEMRTETVSNAPVDHDFTCLKSALLLEYQEDAQSRNQGTAHPKVRGGQCPIRFPRIRGIRESAGGIADVIEVYVCHGLPYRQPERRAP
jgi:hypothetical protein